MIIRSTPKVITAFVLFVLSVGLLLSPLARAETLTFDQALNQILSRSTAIGTQQTNIGYAEANAIPAKFQFVPSVTFDASRTKSENSDSSATTNNGVEANAKLNLIHWGADVANLRAANADVHSQKSTLETTRFTTEDNGVTALINEIQNKQTIEANQGIVDLQANLLKVSHERYDKGYLAAQEVDKITVDLENAEASLSDAQVQEAISHAVLMNYLGTGEIASDWPWKNRFLNYQAKILAQELNLKNHPDYVAAETHAEAENNRSLRNKLYLLPSVDANFTYGYYNGYDSQSGLSYSNGPLAPAWVAGVVVTWPIFDHLVTYSQAKAQTYVAEAADIALVQKTRDLQSNFEASRNDFKIALNAAIAREKTLATSRKIYQDSLRRAQAGRISANDFVIDQQRLYSSELYAVQGWANAHLQFPKLCHALGLRIDQCWQLEK